MNQTFTIITNQYYQNENDPDDRFRTFTKSKTKKTEETESTVIVNQYPTRYFDSPTMIKFDNDEDDNGEEEEIPIVRCVNKSSILSGPEGNLDETDLTDLYSFTNRKFVLILSLH